MRITSEMVTSVQVEAARGNGSESIVRNKAQSSHLSVSDTTTLSSLASLEKSLVSALKNVPEIRYEKIESLRNSIEGGGYSVPADQIAAAITRELKRV